MKAQAPKPGQRGRSALNGVNPITSTHPQTETQRKTGVNKSVGAGDHRGDRRDMSPTYSGNAKHASRGSTPRKDVSTRKR